MSATVVVTGASAGVGRATAIAFAKRGARIGLVARGRAGLEAALAEVRAAGGDGLAVEADVSDHDALELAAAEVEERLGPIDVWVNNAMATVFAPFHRIDPHEYRRATEVTYLGTVHGTMVALGRMRERGAGAIVQVGSALAYRGIPLQAPYCGAKHAIQGFTESLRCELLHEGSPVHVTMVQLPAMNTPQFGWSRNKMGRQPRPVPPIYQPEVAAEAIVWAAGHRRKEVYVGRSTVKAIVGDKLASALADRYLARTGYSAQLLPEPAAHGPDNLEEPRDRDDDKGTHGQFDGVARDGDLETWAITHRGAVVAAAATAAGALAAVGIRRHR